MSDNAADTAKNDLGTPEHGWRIVWDGHIAYSLEHILSLEQNTWERTVFTQILVYGDRGYCVPPTDLDWWLRQRYIDRPLDIARFLAFPQITNIRRYRYRAGDRIIVRTRKRLNMDEGRHAQEVVAYTLGIPSIGDVLVLDGGDDIKVMRNTEETAEKRDA